MSSFWPPAGRRRAAARLSGGTRRHTGDERSLRSRRLQQEVISPRAQRYLPSFRHYVGTVEQVQRECLGNQISNIYHMFDVSVSRRITKRISASASLPILFASRNQLYALRGEFRTTGIGDATVGVHPAPFSTMMYFNAIYLFNPRNTNGVSTFRNRRGETVQAL